ncbi:MAG: hypothetical protein ABI972_28860, partial [Acidobacteriota bacterium]
METGLIDSEMPPVTSDDPHETINSATAHAFVVRESSFMNFSRYEANLSRAFDRTLKQIHAIRKENFRAPAPASDETKPTLVENKDPRTVPTAQ